MTIRELRVRRDREETVPAHAPEWSEGNEHDPGVTLLALCGFLGSSLLWQFSGRKEGAASRLSRWLAAAVCAASGALLLRRGRRRRRPQP